MIFAIVIIFSALLALVVAGAAFQAKAAIGVMVLVIFAPMLFFFYVILYRVFLKVVMAVFTIAENTTRMVHGMSAPTPAPSATSPYPPAGSWAQPTGYPAQGPYPQPGRWSAPPTGS